MPPKQRILTKDEREEEEERARAEAEILAAEAAEEARYKHVTQLDLNLTTRDPMPSVSPRDQLSYVGDKKPLKDITKFREKNVTLNKFFLRLNSEILENKPDNIIKWVDRYFFSDSNVAKLRRELNIVDEIAEKERAALKAAKKQRDMLLGKG
jgi:hypothetical protein